MNGWAEFRKLLKRSRPFGVSLLGLCLVFSLRFALNPFLEQQIAFSLLVMLTIAVSYYYGLWPSLFVLACSIPTALYFFVRPYNSFKVEEKTDLMLLLVYVLVALVAIILNVVFQRRLEQAERDE